MFLSKSSLSLLILFSFIGCNVAVPAPRYRRDVSEEGMMPVPKNVEESVKQLTSEIEKSVKNLAENSQWIFNNLVTITRTTVQAGFQNVGIWLVDTVARMEFLSMADGSHMFFPLNRISEIEQEYKTVAIAVSKLLMNLKTMERTDEIVKNVSRHLVTKDIDPHLKEIRAAPEKMLRTLLHMYFETLDRHMEADEDVRAEYKQRKTEAREVVKRDPTMREPPFKVWDKSPTAAEQMSSQFKSYLESHMILRQGATNKLFMKQCAKHFSMIFSPVHHRRYLLARALIQKARSSSSDSKINQVYHKALVRAAELPIEEEDDDVLNAIFNLIESSLESELALNSEIRAIMKQIEGNTVYDTDMFYIDVSIL